jgi:cell division septal protein FtsQ
LRRREVKRSYDLSDLNRASASGPRMRSHSGARRKGSYLKRVLRWSPYIIASAALLYVVFFSSLFQIGKLDVQGPNALLSQSLEKEINNYLNSRLLARNWLVLNSGDLKAYLQKTFTGQESITVIKKFPNKITVSTDEQKPALLWKTGSRSYVLSTNGRAITEQNNTGQDLAVVSDNTNLPVDIGSRVASRDFVDFAASINSFLKSNKIEFDKIYITDTTSELYVQTKQGYVIKFSTSLNPESQARALRATLDQLASQKKKPASYIDLRVDGRAFYK